VFVLLFVLFEVLFEVLFVVLSVVAGDVIADPTLKIEPNPAVDIYALNDPDEIIC